MHNSAAGTSFGLGIALAGAVVLVTTVGVQDASAATPPVVRPATLSTPSPTATTPPPQPITWRITPRPAPPVIRIPDRSISPYKCILI
ncbi:hypothetical protein AB0O01_08365 [Streptomyces sp. NPDC093252]|uniref:hypothetical protein n=1 Tax=Streptomyces sp. NPDC093252 TaxID=3154980 RepID=UPI00342D7907